MLTVLTAAAFLLAGTAIVRRLWPAGSMASLERLSAAATAALALWLASLWTLALTSSLTRTALIVRTVVVLIAGVALTIPRLRPVRLAAPVAVVFATISGWVVFVLWRGWVVPPLSHDALAYHLPRAVLFMRARGWTYVRELVDWRLRDFPANYELILADTLILEGNDRISEWPSALFYVLFAVAAGALAQRWWPRIQAAAAATCVFAAGVPVLLLHAGAHKNDILTAVGTLHLILWTGRWLSTGELRALIFAIVAGAMSVGTKPQPAVVILALAPLIARSLWRRRATIPAVLVAAVLAFFLLGGFTYVAGGGAPSELEDPTRTRYGEWKNLWQAPYVLLAAPFSSGEDALYVPWESRPWFWERYEIFFSHLGIPFVLALPLLPLGRRIAEGRRERVTMLIATGVALLALLPVAYDPHGFYTISLPRYVIHIAAVVFAFTIPPLAARYGALIAYLGCASFAAYALDAAINDRFAPLSYAVWARDYPGTRVIPVEVNRAASVVDRRAGPRDFVAIDAGYGTWIHPAFGADLQRPVVFIPPGDGPPRIPAEAKWVVIERSWGVIWQHPELHDLSAARGLLLRGTPTPDELRVLNHLRPRKDFRLVFYNPRRNQAVFERIEPPTRP